MNRGIALAVGMILVVSYTAGCLEEGEDKTVTMTLGEFSDDYMSSTDNDTRVVTDLLMSLEPGDVLLLRDTITNMTYLTAGGFTQVEFASSPGTGFPIEGDVTSTLSSGDTIKVRLHIIAITYTEQFSSGTWTFKQEYFREGWNKDNETFVPIPRDIVSRVSSGAAVTMTMGELIADFDYSYDNNTKTITNVLTSLNDGDIVIINDTLYTTTYNASGGYTVIDFETMKGYTFFIEGDITGDYTKGDNVTLTLHIIRVTTTQDRNGTEWTIEEETFAEEWNNGEYVPLPQSSLRHA